MKSHFKIVAIFLGLNSILSQAVLIRELIVNFYGNEFFVGIVFAFWFFWVSIGSIFLASAFLKFFENFDFLLIILSLSGFLLFFEIFLINFFSSFGSLSGEIPNLLFSVIISFIFLAPLCLLFGIWWTTATQFFCQKSKEKEDEVLNRFYYFEILGFIIGGVVYSFLLIKFQEFIVVNILLSSNLLIACFLFLQKRTRLSKKAGFTIFLFLLLFLFLSINSEKIIHITQKLHFKNQELIQSKNTYYGKITVTKFNGQYNFFENKIFLGSTDNGQFAEEFVHLSLIHHPSPKKVLLVGNGYTGMIEEILKHPVEEIYYLELDPELIKIAEKYISTSSKSILFSPSIKIITQDVRYFVMTTKEKFDFVILNIAPPSTALVNRFYTKEFFKELKEKLTAEGVLAFYIPFSPSAPNKNLENLHSSLFKTLKEVFSEVEVLAGDFNLFLASNKKINQEWEGLKKFFEERKIKTKFLTENYLNYRKTTQRNKIVVESFEKNREAKINQDFLPVSYFYQNLFWLDHFYYFFSVFFKFFSSHFLYFLFSGLILVGFFAKNRSFSRKIPFISVGIAGFSLMALETTILFLYQVMVGYLYFRIALLVSVFMGGMGMGIWYVKKLEKNVNHLAKFHLFLSLFCLISIFLLYHFSGLKSLFWSEIFLFLLAICSGFLGSVFFPIANKIYLFYEKEPLKKTGTIYGVDLVGSCFGAFFPPIILIPVFGVFFTLFFVAILNFIITLFFILHRKLGQ